MNLASPSTDDVILSWEFAGFAGRFAGWQLWLAWLLLALIGCTWIWWSYRRALVSLPPGRRVTLFLLRTGVLLAVLVIAAGPTQVRRFVEEPPPERALAVLVDRSDSMTQSDNRQRRRIDDALRRWRGMEKAAQRAHRGVQVYSFAEDVKLDSLSGTSAPARTSATRLFSALQRVAAEAPPGGWSGIVTLTDGLDTSGVDAQSGAEETARAANARSTALFFVPGRNRYTRGDYFELRDLNVPLQVVPQGSLRVSALFDSHRREAGKVDLELKVDGRTHTRTTVRLDPGRRMVPWSTEVPAGPPGTRLIELQVGGETMKAAVRVHRGDARRILYFQGALDWSYRFLSEALRPDPTFSLTPVLSFAHQAMPLPASSLRHMPSSREELEAYDLVILANIAATQLTPEQQLTLSAWVRDGGVLLFFTPDDDSTQGLAGSELEKMLPVQFASAGGTLAEAAGQFRKLRPGRHAPTRHKELSAFEWEKTSRVQEIFSEAGGGPSTMESPRFQEYATVARAKPGADVLARHAEELAPDGRSKAILLAIQRYGAGQSAVLTTDALWRWKLMLPSGDQQPTRFWQALLSWLMREKQNALRFDQTPRLAEAGRELSVRVAGVQAGPLRLSARLGGNTIPLSGGRVEGRVHTFAWKPPGEGLWELTATDAKGESIQHWVRVAAIGTSGGENSGAPPDEELLRALAARTGGAVLENAPPAFWSEPRLRGGTLLREQRLPAWHQAWLFAALLSLYGAELLLRRLWKML